MRIQRASGGNVPVLHIFLAVRIRNSAPESPVVDTVSAIGGTGLAEPVGLEDFRGVDGLGGESVAVLNIVPVGQRERRVHGLETLLHQQGEGDVVRQKASTVVPVIAISHPCLKALKLHLNRRNKLINLLKLSESKESFPQTGTHYHKGFVLPLDLENTFYEEH